MSVTPGDDAGHINAHCFPGLGFLPTVSYIQISYSRMINTSKVIVLSMPLFHYSHDNLMRHFLHFIDNNSTNYNTSKENNIYIEHLLCTRHFKLSTFHILCYLPFRITLEGRHHDCLSRWGNWSSEKLWDRPRLHSWRGKTRIQTQV